jgi:hypothetical protein
MAFRHVLTSSLDPRVALKEMSIWNDTNEGSKPLNEGPGPIYTSSPSKNNNKERSGSSVPYIQINSFTLKEDSIESLIIDETNFIPTVTLVFEDDNGWLDPVQFPNKNPILSVYIKSLNEKMKPIRNDYVITSINGSSTKIIKGELFIPGIYTNISKSYGELTSRDVLFRTCEDLGLGFQSNQVSPSDKMKWFNPNWNSKDFMKHVISHAYQNDETFFEAFIDKYYYLNYVDANLQLEQDGEFDNTIFTGDSDYNISEDIQSNFNDAILVSPSALLENPKIKRGANVIMERHLVTENGDILLSGGFRKRIYYYDSRLNESDPIDKLTEFYIQPIVSRKPVRRERDLEPINEELKNIEVRKWISVQYKNVHPNFLAARAINSHNMKELNKIKLKVKTSGINSNSIRGMRIPVGIYETDIESRYDKAWDGETKKQVETKTSAEEIYYNEYLSGIYYSIGNRYLYEKGQGFNTEITLSKRDWVPNPEK